MYLLVVVNILVDMYMDYVLLMVVMLYDVIEDIGVFKEQFVEEFSEEVVELVDGVFKIVQIKFELKVEQQVENLCKMMFVMICDICVILVKLVDCLYNMCILYVMCVEKCKCIVMEILEIYVLIVFWLGMYNMCVEYEDFVFYNIYLMCVWLIGKVV